VLSTLGFLGIGGAGLRVVEATEDIERDRTEGGLVELLASGISIG